MATEKQLNEIIECLKFCAKDSGDCVKCLRWDHNCGSRHCVDDLLETAAEVLEELVPLLKKIESGELAPVVHGRWVAVPSSDMMTGKAYICSECKKMRYGSFMPNYCQNCGAKMDGGNHE